MPIKIGQIFKHSPEYQFEPKDHFAAFDREFFKKSMKRTTPIRVRSGITGDDFIRNVVSVVFEAKGVRIPRFMNPVRGRRKGKLRTGPRLVLSIGSRPLPKYPGENAINSIIF